MTFRVARTILCILLAVTSGCGIDANLREKLSSVGGTDEEILTNADALGLPINSSQSIDVLANDTGIGLKLIAISLITGNPDVVAAVDSDTNISVASSNDFQGDISVQYQVMSSSGMTQTGILTISIGYCSGARLADTPFANSSLGVDGLSSPAAFHICSFEQFNRIGTDIAYADKFFQLKNAINFSGVTWATYNQIGSLTLFSGNMDGGGYALENISFTNIGPTASNIGIFDQLSLATISRLRIPNAVFSFAGDVTGFGVLVGGISSSDTFEKIQVSATVTILGRLSLGGGLVSQSLTSNFDNIRVDLDLSALGGATASIAVGGILGYGGSYSLTSVFSTGQISIPTDSRDIGGLAGTQLVGAAITDSFSTLSVTGNHTNSNIGPIRGRTTGGVTITNSYYVGTPVQCSNLGTGSCNTAGTGAVDISVGTGDPNYFFNNTVNSPYSAASWDFTNDWIISPTGYPSINFN